MLENPLKNVVYKMFEDEEDDGFDEGFEEDEDEAGEEDVVEDDEENLDELGDEIPHWETLDEEEEASEKSSDENEIPTEELKKLKEMMEKLFPGSKISVGEIKVN